jgi:hypothetical protein
MIERIKKLKTEAETATRRNIRVIEVPPDVLLALIAHVEQLEREVAELKGEADARRS